MSDRSATPRPPCRWLFTLVAISLAALSACDKAREPAATPATVVMPTDTAATPPSPVAATDAGATGASAQPGVVAPLVTGNSPNGSVSVIAGPVAAASTPVTAAPVPAPSASAPTSAGVPAPSASLPGPGVIGPLPASSPSGDQPPSVSPGTRS